MRIGMEGRPPTATTTAPGSGGLRRGDRGADRPGPRRAGHVRGDPVDSLIAGVGRATTWRVLNNIAPTDKRKQKFDFSVPYAVSEGRVESPRTPPSPPWTRCPGTPRPRWRPPTSARPWPSRAPEPAPVTGFTEAVMLVHLRPRGT
ncbi:hypothetical protein QJS66_15355 [Kocuria rhizophila]|nr:hypothetical protein QJS66_15355 [Kocuria rhizophila]